MSDVPTSLATAIEFHQKGDLDAAVVLYQDIIDGDPENADAWHLMGVVAHQRGNNDLAVTLLENAISLNDDVADFHSNMDMVRRALGEDGAADGAFRRAVEINPNHAKALSNLAGLLRSNGAFSSAVDYARRAVRAGPDDPEAHNNLGNALKDSGGDWVEDAVASYRQALELAPKYALAHWNLSLALLSLGNFEEGFAEMAWRWQWTGFPARRRVFKQPQWKGVGITNDNIEGKRILLHAEQ